MTHTRRVCAWLVLTSLGLPIFAQEAATPASRPSVASGPLGEGPWVFDTAEQHKIRVSVVTKALSRPWSLAFLPDGSILVTERSGRLRIIRNGVLDPTPIAGVPEVRAQRFGGLMDLALHPKFAENRLLYFTYSKPGENGLGATVLGRGRLEGNALTDVRDVFIAQPYWNGTGGQASRIVFAPDGKLFMTTGASLPPARAVDAQDPNTHRGKVLRLNDDGTAPRDNPFTGRPGYKPEIYSLGHRNQIGLAVNPFTGDVWANENGPQGGDEINVILQGRNYGWPLVSFGRDYPGPRQGVFWKEGFEAPSVFWVPSIGISGMTFYTGDRFPSWKGNVFVGSMRTGGIEGTGHVERVIFNRNWEDIRRESILGELRRRVRDVRQGPDGFLYVLTDEDPGALLRIEPTTDDR